MENNKKVKSLQKQWFYLFTDLLPIIFTYRLQRSHMLQKRKF